MNQLGPRCPTHEDEMMILGEYSPHADFQDAHQIVNGNTYYCNECVDVILDQKEREDGVTPTIADEQYILRYTRASIEKVLYGMGYDPEKRIVDAVADVMAGIPIIKQAIETQRIQKMLTYQKLHQQGAEYQRTGNINAFFK